MAYRTSDYYSLTVPAPVRLARMRHDSAFFNRDHPHCPEHSKPKSWRDMRKATFRSLRSYVGGLDQGFNGTGKGKIPVWYCHTGPQFRHESFADKCKGGPDHTGWFTDSHQDAMLRGVVGRLTHGRFIAGYWSSQNEERVYFPEVHYGEADAARAAEEHARVAAEGEREYQDRSAAMSKLAQGIEDVEMELNTSFALRNHKRFPGARKEAAGFIARIRILKEKLKTEYGDLEY